MILIRLVHFIHHKLLLEFILYLIWNSKLSTNTKAHNYEPLLTEVPSNVQKNLSCPKSTFPCTDDCSPQKMHAQEHVTLQSVNQNLHLMLITCVKFQCNPSKPMGAVRCITFFTNHSNSHLVNYTTPHAPPP